MSNFMNRISIDILPAYKPLKVAFFLKGAWRQKQAASLLTIA